jgi:hypothetical protein
MASERVPVRVDVWWVGVVATGVAILLAVVSPLLLDAAVAWPLKLLVGAFAAGTLALTFGVSIPLRYLLEPEGVTVRAGVLTLRFAYRDIIRIDRVVSPLSGPSWSPVRVRMAMRAGGWIEIAPRDREAFLASVRARAPHLKPSPRGLRDAREKRA